jgi:RNA polymerase sigma-70 factor (ECF subfamily)
VDPREFVVDLVARLAATARAAIADAELTRFADELAATRASHAALPLDAPLAAAIATKLGDELAGPVAKLRLGDLALATWAARGDPAAIAAFDAAHGAVLARVYARFHRIAADELRQALHVKLFVADADGHRRIDDYDGFGFLENWVKVTAVRCCIDVARGDARRAIDRAGDDDALAELPSPATGPQTAEMRRELAALVKRELSAAAASLTPRERNFLRHAHVENRTLDQIAATYGVHRATVARVLASARAALLERTRAGLARAIGPRDGRVESLVKQIDSKIELSLERVLHEDSE